MILPGVNEVILAHTKLDPGIPVAPMDYLIQHSTEATPYTFSNPLFNDKKYIALFHASL